MVLLLPCIAVAFHEGKQGRHSASSLCYLGWSCLYDVAACMVCKKHAMMLYHDVNSPGPMFKCSQVVVQMYKLHL
jgi:hypothetical protein